jgi:hypothetical protein
MIDKLPQPTEEELNMTGKHEYFSRILEMDLDKKLKIDYQQLTGWISHNFNSVYLINKELTYKEYLKLIK